ncbi:hypothetical protein ABZP36_023614 [Zizania latifolia]
MRPSAADAADSRCTAQPSDGADHPSPISKPLERRVGGRRRGTKHPALDRLDAIGDRRQAAGDWRRSGEAATRRHGVVWRSVLGSAGRLPAFPVVGKAARRGE